MISKEGGNKSLAVFSSASIKDEPTDRRMDAVFRNGLGSRREEEKWRAVPRLDQMKKPI